MIILIQKTQKKEAAKAYDERKQNIMSANK